METSDTGDLPDLCPVFPVSQGDEEYRSSDDKEIVPAAGPSAHIENPATLSSVMDQT
ncbi:carbohydrate esterase family 16 protein [Tulasnella calospora MUT 4182]|uniref:Carbohydrate esterase family 16 protein n=1 Tax=Tulasnella calospora MUT 4182 TaxID=1051891 RepID=A0A0C3PXF9_9AGAM|nr:carbohydrate esterase family 16 protein [Tulasnella calospora MUT 4182]